MSDNEPDGLKDLYAIAREVTDNALGPGTYAEVNRGTGNPRVQAEVEESNRARDRDHAQLEADLVAKVDAFNSQMGDLHGLYNPVSTDLYEWVNWIQRRRLLSKRQLDLWRFGYAVRNSLVRENKMHHQPGILLRHIALMEEYSGLLAERAAEMQQRKERSSDPDHAADILDDGQMT